MCTTQCYDSDSATEPENMVMYTIHREADAALY